MKDLYGREIEYMRISITDRCNLRCRYCMPEGEEWIPAQELLTCEEICRVCRQAVKLGIRSFKITGGEPLVRKGCAELIRNIRGIPGVDEVTMTTNGVLLSEYLEELKDAGLRSVNVSLDSLNRERYREITGFDKMEQVLESVREALKKKMDVKINTVLQKEKNEEEWESMLRLAENQNITVRFIELMPIGKGKQSRLVSNKELLSQMKNRYPGMKKDEGKYGNGPAVYYKIPGFAGRVGFISAIHGNFCSLCNRIRMTSTGRLKSCLCYQGELSVREALRSGDDEAVQRILKDAILQKPRMHCFEEEQRITEQGQMAQIGG